MMKKWIVLLLVSITVFLGGCSLLNDAKNTVIYINEATDFLNKATNFANEAPSLAQQAVSDPQAAEELEIMLKEMKQDIEAFNELQTPELAADLHQQIVDQNNIASQGIDMYLNNFVDGKLDPAVLKNTELYQTVEEISGIINQIKQLGQ